MARRRKRHFSHRIPSGRVFVRSHTRGKGSRRRRGGSFMTGGSIASAGGLRGGRGARLLRRGLPLAKKIINKRRANKGGFIKPRPRVGVRARPFARRYPGKRRIAF